MDLPHISARFRIRHGETVPLSLNWIKWLGNSSLLNAEWASSDPALQIGNQQMGQTVTTGWFSGGAPDTEYDVTVTVQTTLGATFIANVKVECVP